MKKTQGESWGSPRLLAVSPERRGGAATGVQRCQRLQFWRREDVRDHGIPIDTLPTEMQTVRIQEDTRQIIRVYRSAGLEAFPERPALQSSHSLQMYILRYG